MVNKLVQLKTISPELSLYHYTKCGGVQGILQEKAFRATKSDFLHDTNEMQYILSVVQSVLEEIHPEEQRALLQERFLGTLHEMKKRSYYIVSFSTEPDSITLWAEFGENTGYNLEFQSGELIQDIEEKRKVSYHGEVIYSKEEQKRMIRGLLTDGIPRALGSSFEAIMEQAQAEGESPLFQTYCSCFEKVMAIYAIFFKQEEFSAEKEYRMVFKVPEKRKVKYREKDGCLLPYITVRLKNERKRVPLRSITVAPKNHVDLAREGMRQYLRQLGYDVEVHLSNIKLRY